tara:strand:- start:4189 stop:4524 length:336 start_codon:yes stop_codon:yes gene_type:complete
MLKKHILTTSLMALLSLSGCVTNNEVMVAQPGDNDLTCPQLKGELESLGVRFQESKLDSGITGKNIVTGLLFWPGILVNEYQASKNSQSVMLRSEHLARIYNGKCSSKKGS